MSSLELEPEREILVQQIFQKITKIYDRIQERDDIIQKLRAEISRLEKEMAMCGHCGGECYDDGTCLNSFSVPNDEGNEVQFVKSRELYEVNKRKDK